MCAVFQSVHDFWHGALTPRYLHQWFLTLFINCFPISMARASQFWRALCCGWDFVLAKVMILWDVIMCEGLPVILRIAVSILQVGLSPLRVQEWNQSVTRAGFLCILHTAISCNLLHTRHIPAFDVWEVTSMWQAQLPSVKRDAHGCPISAQVLKDSLLSMEFEVVSNRQQTGMEFLCNRLPTGHHQVFQDDEDLPWWGEATRRGLKHVD